LSTALQLGRHSKQKNHIQVWLEAASQYGFLTDALAEFRLLPPTSIKIKPQTEMSNTPNALTNGATRQHHWTDNEVENLRQAGVRVANGQSTWADEMVNMPAGLRLRNCRERFGRSFDHAGNPKAQTAACPPYNPANLPLYVSAPAPIVPAPVLPAPVVLAPVVPTNTPANLPTSLPAQAIPIFNK
jgi:hypothetical protein